MKASKKEFIAEAEELLSESQRLVLEIQDTYKAELNPDTINALFRSMHTLKGLSGLFGDRGITDLSHTLESFLDEVRLGKIEVTDEVVSFLLKNLDILRALVDGIVEEKKQDVTPYLKEVESFRASMSGKTQDFDLRGLIDESIIRVLSEYEEHRLRANIKEGKGIYLIKVIFDLTTFDKSLERLTKTIKSKAELISTLPVSSNVPDGFIGFNLMVAGIKQVDELKEDLLSSSKDTAPDINVLVPPKAEQPQPRKQQELSLKSTTTFVRVDIEKLDRILNTISELALAKDAVKRIYAELLERFGHSSLVLDVHRISQTFERRLSELQGQVLEIRMVPIGQIFSRLAQVIRRYSKEIGKQAELVMYGEDTELDKYLAEEIVDPLMHIVRNSIDHGIEPAEERKKKGKKEYGTITLKAFQRGNHVVVEVIDDGRGIDVEKVRKKARDMGLLEPDTEPEEREIIDFVFTPGFSTKDVATEISGRGVGMDVVREKLSMLGGFAEVSTRKDEGITFTLTLPITLAIIKALIVRVGKEMFAVPLTSISETIVIEHKDIQTIEWKEVYYFRGEMLPMMSVGKMFNLETDQSDRSFAVVVGFGERKLGLLVDELLGQHEIVIKSLGDYLKGLSGFAGAAEIGKHEVILVLDVESLIEKSLVKHEGMSYV
ncbi:MAG: chemotaxis protein CheA [Nitrospirota bacterium]